MKQRERACCYLLTISKCAQGVELDLEETGSQELNPGTPCEREGPNHVSIIYYLPRCILATYWNQDGT